MFRHVVLFRYTTEATPEQKQAVTDALRDLPTAIPEIKEYRVGADAGDNEGNHEFAVVADFDDVDAYLVYRDHPAHLAVIAERIRPILAERAAVQYET